MKEEMLQLGPVETTKGAVQLDSIKNIMKVASEQVRDCLSHELIFYLHLVLFCKITMKGFGLFLADSLKLLGM